MFQRSALPALDAENEQKYRETMTALRVTRSLNTEIERLKLENGLLTRKVAFSLIKYLWCTIARSKV